MDQKSIEQLRQEAQRALQDLVAAVARESPGEVTGIDIRFERTVGGRIPWVVIGQVEVDYRCQF